MVKVIHGQLRIDRLLIGPACLLLCFARVIYVASGQPTLSFGPSIWCKISIFKYCLIHKFKSNLCSSDKEYKKIDYLKIGKIG
jgi:hypothetical protein